MLHTYAELEYLNLKIILGDVQKPALIVGVVFQIFCVKTKIRPN